MDDNTMCEYWASYVSRAHMVRRIEDAQLALVRRIEEYNEELKNEKTKNEPKSE